MTQALKSAVDQMQGAITFDCSKGFHYKELQDPTSEVTPVSNMKENAETSLTVSEINSMHKVLYNTVNRL